MNNIINQAAASRTLNPGPADPAVLGAPGRLWLHPSPVAGRGLPASHKAPAPPALPGARERCAAGGGGRQSGALLSSAAKGASRAATRGRGVRADLVAMGGPRHRRGPLWPRAWPPLGMPHARTLEHGSAAGRLAVRPRPGSQKSAEFQQRRSFSRVAEF